MKYYPEIPQNFIDYKKCFSKQLPKILRGEITADEADELCRPILARNGVFNTREEASKVTKEFNEKRNKRDF